MMRIPAALATATTVAMLTTPAAEAADSMSGPPRHAAFSGSADPRAGGEASTCFVVVTTGPVTPLPCEASFAVDDGDDVCRARANARVATFDYTSSTTGFSVLRIPLHATAGQGVGFLLGEGTIGGRVFTVRISINALCTSPQASGPFEGWLTYV